MLALRARMSYKLWRFAQERQDQWGGFAQECQTNVGAPRKNFNQSWLALRPKNVWKITHWRRNGHPRRVCRRCPFLLQWVIFPTILRKAPRHFVWRSCAKPNWFDVLAQSATTYVTFLREAPQLMWRSCAKRQHFSKHVLYGRYRSFQNISPWRTVKSWGASRNSGQIHGALHARTVKVWGASRKNSNNRAFRAKNHSLKEERASEARASDVRSSFNKWFLRPFLREAPQCAYVRETPVSKLGKINFCAKEPIFLGFLLGRAIERNCRKSRESSE